MTETIMTLDVRPIPCSAKCGLVIQKWLGLAVGDSFVLLNDRDPVSLHCQFSTDWSETFSWEYLVNGPDEFRVKITKLKPLGKAAEPEITCGSRQ